MLFRASLLSFSLVISRVAGAEPRPASSRVDDSVVARSRLIRSSWSADRLALLAHLGIGAPAGALGLDLDVAPVPAVAINLAAGVSLGGLQLAATPRVRFRSGERSWLTVGSGVSVGRYVNQNRIAGLGCLFLCALEQNGESPARQTFGRAVWYNFELGADVYKGERSLLRMTLGFGILLNSKDYTCAERSSSGYPPGDDCDRSSGQNLLFGTFSYGFDI